MGEGGAEFMLDPIWWRPQDSSSSFVSGIEPPGALRWRASRGAHAHSSLLSSESDASKLMNLLVTGQQIGQGQWGGLPGEGSAEPSYSLSPLPPVPASKLQLFLSKFFESL